jgi:hypothetical protein
VRKSEREKLIAHHEAGHAVVARLLGVGMTYAALFPTAPDSAAVAQTCSAAYLALGEGRATHLAGVEKDVKVAFGGPLAQVKYHPKSEETQIGFDGDIADVMQRVVQLVLIRDGTVPDGSYAGKVKVNAAQQAEIDREFIRLQQEAAAIVDINWPAIKRLAAAIIKHRIPLQNEVDALILTSNGASHD